MFYSLYDPNRQGIVGPRMANIVRYAALLTMADPNGGYLYGYSKATERSRLCQAKD